MKCGWLLVLAVWPNSAPSITDTPLPRASRQKVAARSDEKHPITPRAPVRKPKAAAAQWRCGMTNGTKLLRLRGGKGGAGTADWWSGGASTGALENMLEEPMAAGRREA